MDTNKIKAVIFDMDGTTFDTERLSTEGWREAGKKIGYPLTEELIADFRGNNNAVISSKLVAYGYSEEMAEMGWHLRDAYARDYVNTYGVPLKPGLFALLDFLKEKNITMALSTGSDKDRAVNFCTKAGIVPYFDAWVFGNEIPVGKPDPSSFLITVEKLGLDPSDCLVIEDSFNGVIAAKRAGCKVIMIPDQDAPTPEITEMCDAVLDTLDKVRVFFGGSHDESEDTL